MEPKLRKYSIENLSAFHLFQPLLMKNQVKTKMFVIIICSTLKTKNTIITDWFLNISTFSKIYKNYITVTNSNSILNWKKMLWHIKFAKEMSH